MRRVIVGCLLLIAILGITNFVLTTISKPLEAEYTTPQAVVHISAQSPAILAGQCAVLTWDARAVNPDAGQFYLATTKIDPKGQLAYCTLPTEGFVNIGITYVPKDGSPAENYTVSPMIIPQDLRLWSLYALGIGAFLLAIYLLLPLKFVHSVGTLKIFTTIDNFADRHKNWPRVALVILCGIFAYNYINDMGWSPSELAHIGVGFIALWGGSVLFCYIILQDQIEDKVIRVSFSAIAGYTLTSMFFFLAAVSKLEWLYNVGQVVLWGLALFVAIRHKIWRHFTIQNFLRIDWILILLILLSMIVMEGLKTTYGVAQNGTIVYRVSRDQVYNAGLSYELNRHIPPQQMTIYAGVPERAYHLLPHLTTMLMARYTDQPDMLTAQVQYGYTVFEALICLGMFSIVRLLTKSRWAGYLAVVIVYILAIPWFALTPSPNPYLYFTIFPFGINGLEAVTLTSPEMYSSVPILYAVMVGIILIGFRSRRNLSVSIIVGLTALMAASLLRFRLQFALAVIPVTLLWFMWWAIQKRRWVYVVGIAILFAFTGILYLEMQSPVYLTQTAQLLIQNNGLMDDPNSFLRTFPFSTQLHDWVYSLPDSATSFLNGTRDQWLWQFIGMTGFVALNMIGIPSLLTFLSISFNQFRKREFLFFCLFILFLTAANIAGGTMLAVPYDNYSVGGQLLLNPGWYLLPLVPVGIWSLYVLVYRDLRLSRVIWIGFAGILLIAFLYERPTVPPSTLQNLNQVNGIISQDEFDTFHYIRDSTPQDAVVFAKDWYFTGYYFVSGTAGRVSYADNIGGLVDSFARQIDPRGDRQLRINELLAAKTDDQFCELLWKTPITHIIEYQVSLYKLHPQECLEKIWTSPNALLYVWHVKPATAIKTTDISPDVFTIRLPVDPPVHAPDDAILAGMGERRFTR